MALPRCAQDAGRVVTTFKSDDGRTLDEADVRALIEWVREYMPKPVLGGPWIDPILAALEPKPAPTCGAKMVGDPGELRLFQCALPPPDKDGFHRPHHKFKPCCPEHLSCFACGVTEDQPEHWAGHMPSADSWREPK